MFSKSNLISTLVTALWAYIGGGLLWIIIATPLLEGHEGTATGVWKESPDHLHLIIGCIIMAFAFSTIYSKLSGRHSLFHGAKFGLSVGILIGFGDRFIDFAVANIMDLTGTLISAVVYVVWFAVMGILASLVYGKTSSSGD
ncbi:MAG: hypothetical protein IIC74_09930 [Bacteroidetes bacterium]|nr:hypothetical protein [Bacteroidota bacterium]